MIPLSRVQKTAREWLLLRVKNQYPAIYDNVTKKDNFESLTKRIHVMVNRILNTPIKAGPNKTVVYEFRSEEAIDAYIIRCLMTYCAIWVKRFDTDGPVAVTGAEPDVLRSKEDTVAVGHDEGNADPVRLDPGCS